MKFFGQTFRKIALDLIKILDVLSFFINQMSVRTKGQTLLQSTLNLALDMVTSTWLLQQYRYLT